MSQLSSEHPYELILIRTHLVRPGESLARIADKYVLPKVQKGDVVFISEKLVATCQGRLVHGRRVRVRPLARWLSRFVYKNPGGMGIRQPVVMEMAMREVGAPRVLLAAAVAMVGKSVGRRGDFYRVCGRRVAAIDGPNPHTIPPYGSYVVLCPENAGGVAAELGKALRTHVAVVDVNDLGVEILGATEGTDMDLLRGALKKNPLGQGHQRTPIGIIRPRQRTAVAATTLGRGSPASS